MTEFLAWLYATASAVYYWFGAQFWSYVEIVIHTWDWIVQEGQVVYNQARQFILEVIQDAYDDINGLFDWVEYQFGQFTAGIAEDLSGLYDWVSYQIEQIQNMDFSWIDDLISQVYAYINDIPGQIYDWVYERMGDVQNWVSDNFGWVFGAIDWLTGLVNLIDFTIFDRVNDFFNNLYVQISEFFANPVAYILDLLWPYVVSALCFIFAHALGTTIFEISYNPPWKE